MKDPRDQYLGDSISIGMRDDCATLVRERSDGSRVEICLDPLVARELYYWIEDNKYIQKLPDLMEKEL